MVIYLHLLVSVFDVAYFCDLFMSHLPIYVVDVIVCYSCHIYLCMSLCVIHVTSICVCY